MQAVKGSKLGWAGLYTQLCGMDKFLAVNVGKGPDAESGVEWGGG